MYVHKLRARLLLNTPPQAYAHPFPTCFLSSPPFDFEPLALAEFWSKIDLQPIVGKEIPSPTEFPDLRTGEALKNARNTSKNASKGFPGQKEAEEHQR